VYTLVYITVRGCIVLGVVTFQQERDNGRVLGPEFTCSLIDEEKEIFCTGFGGPLRFWEAVVRILARYIVTLTF
jgi:hypothetical protein